MALGAEIAAALRVGSRLGPRRDDEPDALVRGLAWLPAVGFVIGRIAAAVTMLVRPPSAVAAGALGAMMLAILGGPWLRVSVWPAIRALVLPGDADCALARLRAVPGVGGIVVAVGLVVAAAAALAAMPPPGRTVALLLAPTLARWAMVVQCHGGRGTPARAPATAIVGRASFREFGIASVTALGAALVLADARGLAAAMGAAGIMLGMRVLAHRRLDGVSGRLVAATGGLVELEVLVVLAALG